MTEKLIKYGSFIETDNKLFEFIDLFVLYSDSFKKRKKSIYYYLDDDLDDLEILNLKIIVSSRSIHTSNKDTTSFTFKIKKLRYIDSVLRHLSSMILEFEVMAESEILKVLEVMEKHLKHAQKGIRFELDTHFKVFRYSYKTNEMKRIYIEF